MRSRFLRMRGCSTASALVVYTRLLLSAHPEPFGLQLAIHRRSTFPHHNNLVGHDLGPTITRWLSDMQGGRNAQALGDSILIVSLSYLFSAGASFSALQWSSNT